MKKQNITVIGSGIIGICCAVKLQMQGHNVQLIDKNEPASGCSKGNAGHFATDQIFPLATKQVLKQLPKFIFNPTGPLKIKSNYLHQITPWMIRFLLATRQKQINLATKALRNLNEAAMLAYEPLLKEAKLQHLIENNGYLLVFEKDHKNKIINRDALNLEAYDIKTEIMNEESIHALEPALVNAKSALFFPDISHSTDPYKLTLGLFNHFITLGGHFKQCEITNIKIQTDKNIQLLSENKIINTDKVIIAAGAHSQILLDKLNIKTPLDTERGYHLMLDEKNLINRPIAFTDRKFIMTPLLGGTRLAGTVEFAGLKNKPDWHRADMLLDHAQHYIKPLQHVSKQACQKWMGFRPSFPDSLPVIDHCHLNTNILFCFGHQHLGLTQAAISANLIADLINKKQTSFDISPYSIQRF